MKFGNNVEVTYVSLFVALGSLSDIEIECTKCTCSYMNTYKVKDPEKVPFQNYKYLVYRHFVSTIAFKICNNVLRRYKI